MGASFEAKVAVKPLHYWCLWLSNFQKPIIPVFINRDDEILRCLEVPSHRAGINAVDAKCVNTGATTDKDAQVRKFGCGHCFQDWDIHT